jgi:hypothetical protein
MVAQARGTDGRNTYHEARVPGWHNPTQGDIPRNTVAGARSTLLVEQLCVRIDIYMCWGMCPKRPRKWRHEGGAGSAGAVMGLCRRLSRRRPEQPASVRTVGWWPFWAKGPNVKESTSCPPVWLSKLVLKDLEQVGDGPASSAHPDAVVDLHESVGLEVHADHPQGAQDGHVDGAPCWECRKVPSFGSL